MKNILILILITLFIACSSPIEKEETKPINDKELSSYPITLDYRTIIPFDTTLKLKNVKKDTMKKDNLEIDSLLIKKRLISKQLDRNIYRLKEQNQKIDSMLNKMK